MAGTDNLPNQQISYLRLALLVLYILPTVIYCQPQPHGTLHYHKHIGSEHYNAYEVQLGIKNASMIDVNYTITFQLEKCCPVFMFGFCGGCSGYWNHCSPAFSDYEAIFLPYFIDMNIEIKKPGCQFYTNNSSYVCQGSRKLVTAAPRPWNLGVSYICGKTKSIDVTLDMELTYYTHTISKCFPLPKGTCEKAVSYKQMALPNVLGQTEKDNVGNLFALLMMMKEESDDCYQHFTKFICYTLYPDCNRGQVTYPCKQMCVDFREACGGEFQHVQLCGPSFPTPEDHIQCFYNPVVCPKLKPPTSGSVTSEGHRPFNMSHYTCNQGYTLHGNDTRQCMYSGLWTGTEPICWKTSDPMVPVIISLLLILLVIIVGVMVCERKKILKFLQRPRSMYVEVM